ncbi:MAG: hypothetical protein LQ349_006895 [Xanthoria aureola]|nr:MAG: hypothetical protein LQ349_006895 [Xanthoria aureola]
MDDPSTQAFLLACLTAGGGITGYARTGSIPSIAAGVTVGALVYSPSPLPVSAIQPAPPNIKWLLLRSRRFTATEPATLRRGIGLAGFGDLGGEFGATGDQDDETFAHWVEYGGGFWAVSIWDVVEWEGDGVKDIGGGKDSTN